MLSIEEKAKLLSDIFAITDVVPKEVKDKIEGIILGVALAHDLAKNNTQLGTQTNS